MSDSISITIEYEKVEITILQPDFIQVNLLEPTILASVSENTTHRLGDGSDHSDVAFNSAFVDSEGYNNSPLKAVLDLADIISIETSTGGVFSKVKATLQILKDLIGGGGGGGGIWEEVEKRPMTGKLVELFPVTDDHMKLRFDNVSTAGATDQIFPRVKLSLNNGVSYPSKWDGRGWQAFLSLGYINFTNSAQMLMLRNGINDNVNGSIEFNGLLDAGDVTMYESGGVGNNSGNGLDTNTQKGRFNEVGVITTISVQDNKPLSTGYITLLKRLF